MVAEEDTSQEAIHEAMIDACRSGDVTALNGLFKEHGIPPKDAFPLFLPRLLFKAVEAKQLEMVKFLLALDDSRDLVNYAIGVYIVEHPHAEIAELLCERFARDNNAGCLPDLDPGDKITYLQRALHSTDDDIFDVLRVFLKYGADTDTFTVISPLGIAIDRKPPMPMDIVETMVKRCKTMDAISLMCAIGTGNKNGNSDMLRLFLTHPNIPDRSFSWALEKATESKNEEMVQLIQERQRDAARQKVANKQPMWGASLTNLKQWFTTKVPKS